MFVFGKFLLGISIAIATTSAVADSVAMNTPDRCDYEYPRSNLLFELGAGEQIYEHWLEHDSPAQNVALRSYMFFKGKSAELEKASKSIYPDASLASERQAFLFPGFVRTILDITELNPGNEIGVSISLEEATRLSELDENLADVLGVLGVFHSRDVTLKQSVELLSVSLEGLQQENFLSKIDREKMALLRKKLDESIMLARAVWLRLEQAGEHEKAQISAEELPGLNRAISTKKFRHCFDFEQGLLQAYLAMAAVSRGVENTGDVLRVYWSLEPALSEITLAANPVLHRKLEAAYKELVHACREEELAGLQQDCRLISELIQ